MKKQTLQTTISKDGTRIACHRTGAGPPLVLVPGTGAANPLAWTAVVAALVDRFSLYAVDRRGRGQSDAAEAYAIEREFEDIAAVVEAIGEPAYLLGHSSGGVCALEATLLTRDVRKLILYEPAPFAPGASTAPMDIGDRLQVLLDAGDRNGVLTTFYREVAMMSPREIEQLQASPAWPARLSIAHTIPREVREFDVYEFDPRRFENMHTPTLLLLGGDSASSVAEATAMIAAALPDSRVALLPGQGHIAMYTAPHLFVHEVLTFLHMS